MLIRSAISDDNDAIWCALEPTIRAGETLALPREFAYWFTPTHDVRAVIEHDIAATYFPHANQSEAGVMSPIAVM